MNAPDNFIGSFFWDSKSASYSMSRMVMFGSFIVTMGIGVISMWIVFDSYRHGKAIPDLSWLLYGGSGSGLTGVGAYAMNRFGNNGQNFVPQIPNETEDETEEE